MNDYISNAKIYFGAANGYTGFRSNFERIFSPFELDKLFIIKGGPGTGKSTLMKRIVSDYSSKCKIKCIFCSSDPRSLDGVLLEDNGIKIGVADGTSPHIIEPNYPGAVEEIINLGDGFNYSELRRKKGLIIDLGEKKKRAYQSAYSALKIAGNIHGYITDNLFIYDIYNKAEMLSNELTSNECIGNIDKVKSDFLLGAFCKDGYKRLSSYDEKKDRVEICGDGISEYVLMSKICSSLINKKRAIRIFPSAFSIDLIDAVETDNTLYLITDKTADSIDSTSLITITNEYERMNAIYHQLLDESKKSFESAALYHFELEDIYSKNISFEKNEYKYNRIVSEINRLFNK